MYEYESAIYMKETYKHSKITMNRQILTIGLLMALVADAYTQYYGNYYCLPGRDVVVHLFEWKWKDIERECTWLAANNFCAVQISPPGEHAVLSDLPNPYPWWQRYQPVSYKLGSRSGTESEFIQMVTTCNNLGVFIYADSVFNHMTGPGNGTGSAGSFYDGDAQSYPGVPYLSSDFHGPADCPTSDLIIQDFNDTVQVRNCRLLNLRDLKVEKAWVRDQIANYMNRLINWGVAGFRVDSAKYVNPEDILSVLNRLTSLSTTWFPANQRAYIYLEVIDVEGNEAISYRDYTYIAKVTEFRHGKNLGDVVRNNNGYRLRDLKNFGQPWNQLNTRDALVFVDNHDNQRGHGAGGFGSVLTFFEAELYKIATAFELAWPYGHVRIMSSYNWPRFIVDGIDQNDWMGPPSFENGTTQDANCFNGDWICEHRWREIGNMVKFHNAVAGQPVLNWYDNTNNAIGFGRGNRGFIAISLEPFFFSQRLQTGLPAGQYCDVITCDNNQPPCGNSGGRCRPEITVDESGEASFSIARGDSPIIAIYK